MKKCMDSLYGHGTLKYLLRGKKWDILYCQELELTGYLTERSLQEQCVGWIWDTVKLITRSSWQDRGHISSCPAGLCLRHSKPGFAPRTNLRKMLKTEMIFRVALSPLSVSNQLWAQHASLAL